MKPRLTLSTDQLWPLIILAGFGFFVSLVPLPPNDFWWHLKIGELIFTDRAIPTTQVFSWTLPADASFFYGAWLSELLFYLLYKIGKLELINFVRNLLAIITFMLLAYESNRQSRSWRLSTLAIALGIAMTLNNLPIRPQIWSWVPFMIYLILLGKYSEGKIHEKWLLLLPIVMIFWVNLHGAFILGGVLIGIYFIGEALFAITKQDTALSQQKIYWIGITGSLTGLAMLANPRFTGIVGYVIDLLSDKPSQKLIEEWQSPTPGGISNLIFYLSILLFILVIAYTRYRLKPTEILLVLSFLWLAWSGQRYVIWFSFVSLPILMKAIHALPLKTPRLTPQRHWINNLILVLIFIPAVLVQPWFVERFPLPDRYWKLVHRGNPQGALIGVETPLAAVDYLHSHPGGKLFNEMGYGSYLIWALPEQKVFIDPRVELYPYEQWQDYIRITRGSQYNELLAQYGADRILLDTELQSELLHILEKDSGWLQEYADPRAQIWTRK